MGIGRTLILAGVALIVIGVLVTLGVGRLPGDIYYRGRNTTFYFPIVTCVVVSVVLSLVMWLINKF
jgi:hypothetical protein